MFTIDLLKGQGLPPNSRPADAAIKTLPFLVPLAAVMILLGHYFWQGATLESLAQIKKMEENQIEDMAAVSAFIKEIENSRGKINGSVGEVSKTINYHIQWTPILMELVENLPETVTLESMSVSRELVKEKSNDKSDGYQYTLRLSVDGGATSEGSETIQDFIQRIRLSKLLASKIQAIKIVSSRNFDEENRRGIRYEIDCVFRENS